MALNLSPADQAEYSRLCLANEAEKQAAITAGDVRAAKKCRQWQGQLYAQFERKQLPPDPPDKWDREQAMSLEQRVTRIEQHLKLGQYADDF